ncbi:diguanylate cyclase domain-containing protein [Kineococcus gynurae]|uniref:Diguanylate cyclase domain-containing protein n=1 Tax=Kineococcus gynurae TaxID=452979 RepID=A0ABV5LWF2_9ACTN
MTRSSPRAGARSGAPLSSAVAGAVATACAFTALGALAGSTPVPPGWGWTIWFVFGVLRADVLQVRLGGGDLADRTVRRMLLGLAVGTAGLLATGLAPLLPLLGAVVAGTHLQWNPRRAAFGGLASAFGCSAVLAAAATLGHRPGLLVPPVPGLAWAGALLLGGLLLFGLVVLNLFVIAVEGRRTADELARLQRQREHDLEQTARQDPLTGLLNRRGLAEGVARLGPDLPAGTTVVFVDLDGFKAVNDRFGRAVGDDLLSRVAERLRAEAGEPALLARLGGDEFVVVLGPGRAGGDPATVERFRAAVPAASGPDGAAVRCGASVGVVVADGRTGWSELLGRADAAMYADKQTTGRDGRA